MTRFVRNYWPFLILGFGLLAAIGMGLVPPN